MEVRSTLAGSEQDTIERAREAIQAWRTGRMDEILTIGEMESRFAGEWLLVEDPQTDDDLEVLGGTVRFHSKDRDEVYRKAAQLRPSKFAVLYTGTLTKDAAIVL